MTTIKWHWALAAAGIFIVLLILLWGMRENAVSNIYFIPAGTIGLFPGGNISSETPGNRESAISVALNDSEVKSYLHNNYTIKNVGPLCYEQSLPDRNIYRSCFIGVEIETQEDYLIAYVDLEKNVVNKTMTMYIRNPVIVPSESATIIP